MKFDHAILSVIVLLCCAMLGGCSVDRDVTFGARNTTLNRTRMTKVVNQFANRNGMRVGKECPRKIMTFVWTRYADFSDQSHPAIKLRVDVFDGALETWLMEKRTFSSKPSERFGHLEALLRQDFRRAFQNEIEIGTKQCVTLLW